MKNRNRKMILIPAVAALALGASMTAYAAGWQQEDETWRYYDNSGEPVTDAWKKSGDNWFWLDSDGEMLTSSLVEDDENFFYVNETGAMVTNEWRELENTDGDDGADTRWYYFGPGGKAYKASESGKTTFKSIGRADGTTGRYAFDEEGRMLYGWVDEESGMLTGEDAWKEGVYYLGESSDGAMRVNQWERLEVEDDESEDDDFDGTYWFFFKSNGKKVQDDTKKINGRKYRFREYGNAVFNWYVGSPSSAAASESDLYYNQPDQCWQAEGWFRSVPDEDIDPEGNENGDEYWYYAQKSGDIVKSQIKKIKGYYYGFDEYGKMLHGLYKMSVNDREIQSYEEIEDTGDLPGENDGWQVYYFGDTPKEGVMKTGTAKLEVDGETYTYNFRKSGSEQGQGYNGIRDGCIYVKGRLLQADKDAKLAVVEYQGTDEEEAGRYLVNAAGKIQKNKKNAKDADGTYYCTDAKGIVVYEDGEKCTDENHKNGHN